MGIVKEEEVSKGQVMRRKRGIEWRRRLAGKKKQLSLHTEEANERVKKARKVVTVPELGD